MKKNGKTKNKKKQWPKCVIIMMIPLLSAVSKLVKTLHFFHFQLKDLLSRYIDSCPIKTEAKMASRVC